MTQSVYNTLVSIEKAMGSGLEHVSISFLPKVIYDIEMKDLGSEKLNVLAHLENRDRLDIATHPAFRGKY